MNQHDHRQKLGLCLCEYLCAREKETSCQEFMVNKGKTQKEDIQNTCICPDDVFIKIFNSNLIFLMINFPTP